MILKVFMTLPEEASCNEGFVGPLSNFEIDLSQIYPRFEVLETERIVALW